MPSRQDALDLLYKWVSDDNLRRHCLAVEAAMRAYAEHFGEDADVWGITGLLHDFDYEAYPEEHPERGAEILREHGYPDEVITAILGHNDETGVARETALAKTLYAVDELCGLILAAAYVRPNGLADMKPKSVKKKLKDKSFAAGIDREQIEQSIEELGMEESEHIQRTITAMQGISDTLLS